MGILTRFYRASFCSRAERALLELADAAPDTRAIVLEDVGLPSGRVELCRWWAAGEFGFFSRSESPSPSEAPPVARPVQDSRRRFDDLLRRLEELDTPKLPNFRGRVRDGLAISMGWGSKQRFRDLHIHNATPGEVPPAHAQLVRFLKENVWSTSGE